MSLNYNIRSIIMQKIMLNRWKNMISKVNDEYKNIYIFSDIDQNIRCNSHLYDWFYFNYRKFQYYYDIKYIHNKNLGSGVKLPKYYIYSNGSKKK